VPSAPMPKRATGGGVFTPLRGGGDYPCRRATVAVLAPAALGWTLAALLSSPCRSLFNDLHEKCY